MTVKIDESKFGKRKYNKGPGPRQRSLHSPRYGEVDNCPVPTNSTVDSALLASIVGPAGLRR